MQAWELTVSLTNVCLWTDVFHGWREIEVHNLKGTRKNLCRTCKAKLAQSKFYNWVSIMLKTKNKPVSHFHISAIFIFLTLICLSACSKKAEPKHEASNSEKSLCPISRTVYTKTQQEYAKKELDKNGIPYSNESLIVAIGSNDVDTVQDMIKLGINIEFIDKGSSHTPLTAALYKNKSEIVRLLVDNGASVNTKDGGGAVPFILAIAMNDNDLAMELINKCARVNIYDSSSNALFTAIEKQKSDIVRLLIQKGADVNKVGGFGIKPIYRAAAFNSLEIVKLLVEGGADIQTAKENGWTPLIIAIQEKQYEIAKYLIEHGANLTSVTKEGFTALNSAKSLERQDVVDMLTSKGVTN